MKTHAKTDLNIGSIVTVTVVDEYKPDDVGHDNEGEEAVVHGEDGMSKFPERLVIDPLCWKRVRDEERLRFFFCE
jgi:hypothetical protein